MLSNVLDFILVVKDSRQFHANNVKLNPTDYSIVRHLGASVMSRMQGDGVYFNTLVPLQSGRVIKYGVILESASPR